jgi:anti-sigma B factor antagonist
MMVTVEAGTPASACVVSVSGELDLAGAPELQSALSGVLEVPENRGRVIVDLTALEFIDSTGLGVVVGAATQAKDLDGNLVVVAAEGRVTSLLRLTRLDEVLAVVPDLTAAQAAVSG